MTNASLPLPASADEHIAPAPRVSVQAFCETVETASAVQTAGEDRRLAKAHVKLQMGGLAAALGAYSNAPTPNVIIIESESRGSDLLTGLDSLAEVCDAGTRVVVIGRYNDVVLYRELLRRGISDYLIWPVSAFDVVRAICGLFSAPDAKPVGRIIAVTGAKGGVGTTTLAVHMATHLVRSHKKRVLLIDQKYQLGHVALYLGIKQTKYHFDELLRNAERLDAALLDGLVTRHSDGLDVIASSDTCLPRGNVKANDAVTVLNYLRQQYDYVLVDSEMENTPWLSSLVNCSDEVVTVCTPDVACLRDLARHIEHLSLTECFLAKLRVIANRTGSELAVSKAGIEHAIGHPVVIEVPNNYVELLKAINSGEPIPPNARGSFTQAIAKWTQMLAALTESSFVHAPAKRKFKLWN